MLLHGIGLNLRTWLPVLPALERIHDVVALDLPGFAGSPPLPDGIASTVPALADAVERVIDDLGLDSPHLAGNSLGGWIALELARRGRARSVVALSPAGMWTEREIAYARRNLDLQRMGARLLAAGRVLTRTAAGRTALMWAQMRPAVACRARRGRLPDPGVATAPGWRSSTGRPGAGRRGEQVRCPVLIAWGTLDTVLLARQGPRFVRRIPNAELRPLPGLGHVPMSDDPSSSPARSRGSPPGPVAPRAHRRPPAPSRAAGRLSARLGRGDPRRPDGRRGQASRDDHQDEGQRLDDQAERVVRQGIAEDDDPAGDRGDVRGDAGSVITGTAAPVWSPRAEA